MMDATLHDQADEIDLHALGLKDQIERALSGRLKRPPEAVVRLQQRFAVAQAARATLRRLAEGGSAR